MTTTATIQEAAVWQTLETVMDPEVPVLSVIDLGIVRQVELFNTEKGQAVRCTITPTYSGCPATDVISMSIRMALLQLGFTQVDIKTVLSPAWTTEWMTQAGREKLKAYGIARKPPTNSVHHRCLPGR